MEFSGKDLRIIVEALKKASAQEESEGFQMHKNILDTLRPAPDETIIAIREGDYTRLLRDIEDSINRESI
jgi:hypothetical protein